MKDECLICGAPLTYLTSEEPLECALCHKKEFGKTRCVKGHYVCDACHMKGLDGIMRACLSSSSSDPVKILRRLMDLPFCHMHGPEHHVLVGAALLTAYKNSGGKVDFLAALREIRSRGSKIPGGVCGFYGACGAAISAGIFVSVVTEATPLSEVPWGLANRMTSSALEAIGEVGGPRCCKRDSYLAVTRAVDFCKKYLGVTMESGEVRCVHSAKNNQCITVRCPFFGGVSA